MNITHNKITSTSKIISRLLFIGCCLSILCVLLFVLGIGILSFANSSISQSLREAYQVFSHYGSVVTPSSSHLIILFLFAIVELGIIFMLLYLLYKLFSNIGVSYTPFEKKQVMRIKGVALVTLIMCIVSSVLDSIGIVLLTGNITITFNAIWFVLAITIYCMAYIFDYGCQLQTQSDETL